MAAAVMRDYERRLDQLEWTCQTLRRMETDPSVKGLVLVILKELRELRGQKESKCMHCGRERGQHQAMTFNCAVGMKTRIGFTQFSTSTRFEPKRPQGRREQP